MAPWGRYLLMFFVTGLVVIGVYAAAFVYQLGAPVEAEYWIPEMKIVKLYLARRMVRRKLVVLGGSNAHVTLRALHHER